ncbi:MAG: response regulator transcription factor [Chloroflexota bacterium]|nr:response regulator transcription factor [Chloroflexota bacterium]MDE3192437.1 response regulator transcription factor [Chloroflexota bacterium]
MTAPIRILIVEDHPIVAEGLRLTLSRAEDLDVVGTARGVADARVIASDVRPDVVLLDYHLPDGTGADAARAIRETAPDAVLLMLSADASDDAMLAAIEAGVSGYVVKSEAVAGIAESVRRAAAGEMLIPPTALTALLARLQQRRQQEARRAALRERLTPRETEVLERMAHALDNQAISDQLGISVATVRVHVQNVIEKLGAHSRLEAVILAQEHHLLSR